MKRSKSLGCSRGLAGPVPGTISSAGTGPREGR
jgi:hypothetical protein